MLNPVIMVTIGKECVSESASIIVLDLFRCLVALDGYREAEPTSQRPGNQVERIGCRCLETPSDMGATCMRGGSPAALRFTTSGYY